MFIHAAAILPALSILIAAQPDPRADAPPRAPSAPAPSAPTPAPQNPTADPGPDADAAPNAATPATAAAAAASAPAKQPARDIAVPYPHPIITEVLYAVPTGDAGDANGDGKRHVSGDEFVELHNPHDQPIQLRGYKLTDSNAPDKGQLRFVFPTLELAPGAMVVIFNGFQCSWFGPVGDEKAAALSPNERFGGAWVFTMKAASQYVAFSNSGDHILLTAPDGTPVHRVSWGDAKDQAAFDKVEPILDDRAMQASKASVQRDSLSRVASFRVHTDLPFAHGGDKLFSPGVWSPLPEPKAKKQIEEAETTHDDGPETREDAEKK